MKLNWGLEVGFKIPFLVGALFAFAFPILHGQLQVIPILGILAVI
jgi:hypothetical protein